MRQQVRAPSASPLDSRPTSSQPVTALPDQVEEVQVTGSDTAHRPGVANIISTPRYARLDRRAFARRLVLALQPKYTDEQGEMG